MAAPGRKRRPVYTEDPEWLQGTGQRLDSQKDVYVEDEMPTTNDLVRACSWSATKLHETSLQPSDLEEELRTHRHASLLMHRRGSAVLASGFNPARHVSMICGRPVMVAM